MYGGRYALKFLARFLCLIITRWSKSLLAPEILLRASQLVWIRSTGRVRKPPVALPRKSIFRRVASLNLLSYFPVTQMWPWSRYPSKGLLGTGKHDGLLPSDKASRTWSSRVSRLPRKAFWSLIAGVLIIQSVVIYRLFFYEHPLPVYPPYNTAETVGLITKWYELLQEMRYLGPNTIAYHHTLEKRRSMLHWLYRWV